MEVDPSQSWLYQCLMVITIKAWIVKMEAYLESCDLWEVVAKDYGVPPFPTNPAMT